MHANSLAGISMRVPINRRWALTLLAAAGLSASSGAAYAQSGALAEPGVDNGVQPGDDFFAYANGDWLKTTRIPKGLGRWTVRDEINARTAEQVAQVMNDIIASPVGPNARKIVDYRAAYLDADIIEARGLAPIQPLLHRIERLRNKAALTRLLGEWLRADVDPNGFGIFLSSHVLGFSVEQGITGETTNLALLLQGGLGLPDREYYLSPLPDKQSIRLKYRDYIDQMLALSACSDTAPRAEAVMRLETALARSHATAEESADDVSNSRNRWMRADFSARAPGMSWSSFFAAAGLQHQDSFVVWQPSAVKGLAALVASQPLQAWQDYLRFHVVDRYADVLPRALAMASFQMHGKVVSGATQQAPREERALGATRQALGEALGRLYVQRHFPRRSMAKVQAITANVVAAFRARVEAVTWLSPSAKAQALEKLSVVYFGVGYPEKWQDYSDLFVHPQDALGNLRRVEARSYRQALARLGQPVDLKQWWLTADTSAAFLLFNQNAYNFAAALLQPTKFDPDASDATNYGAIGAIVGHELSHFVDTLGADWDAHGRKRRWWTAQDLASYESVTEPLVNQFSSYRPFDDVAVDGKASLVENLADLGGLAAAFEAYRQTLGSRVNDAAEARQQDRQFFIGFARAWRSKYHDDALRAQAASDHAPETYRISTVRNLDAWYEAFDVRPGQRLFLEPNARVRVW
jgi:putative endopeptidase